MGTSHSADELARKMFSAGEALSSNRPAIEQSAKAVKATFVTALRSAGVSGTTKVSRAVKARYDIKGGTQNATALVRYTGPAHLLNNRTRQHYITPRGLKGTKRGRQRQAAFASNAPELFGGLSRGNKKGAKAIKIGGDFRAYAFHPGTKGLHFFERAKPIAAKVAPREYRKAGLREPLRRVFQ